MHSPSIQIQIEIASCSRNIDSTPSTSVDERQMIVKKLFLKYEECEVRKLNRRL